MNNLHKNIMVFFFLFAIIFMPVISLLAMPWERYTFSENENRYLTPLPRLSASSVTDAAFMRGFEDWVNDRIIGREAWIKLTNNTERFLGKTEINGVYITPDRMIEAWTGYDELTVTRSLDAIDEFAGRHSNVPVFFILAPTAQEIHRSALPEFIPVLPQNELIRYCYEYLSNIQTIDLTAALEEHSDWYIYYRTDHHWTSLGAYIAYNTAAPVMGYTPLGLGAFSAESFGGFLGTLHSRTLIDSITPDIITVYKHTAGNPEVLVTIGDIQRGSLYFREYLEVKDKYSLFLGPPAPVVQIDTDIPGDRKLLVFKDSYAHCFIPFLTNSYSRITVLDLRLINTPYSDIVNVNYYDAVLFMYNAVTFSDDMNLIKLNAG